MQTNVEWSKRIVKISIQIGIIGMLTGIILGSLFMVNGLGLAFQERAMVGGTNHAAKQIPVDTAQNEVKILAYNIAKGFIHNRGLSFAAPEQVADRLERIADIIRAEQPDLVFLSETIFECGPSPGNQVLTLADVTGMHAWGFGENYNFGLPFYRIVGGNAILSRFPLEAVDNISLIGRQPFYVTSNNRRMLWCATHIAGQRLLLAAVHTDSYSAANNLRQTQQLLDYLDGRPAVLAGDFNANPSEPSIQLLEQSGQFSGAFDGPLTFPSNAPEQRLDFIFAPKSWELVEHRVVQSQASDHFPVVSTFRIPKEIDD